MRFCRVCKGLREFKIIPTMTITLNRSKALQYCLECKTVVFAEASEEVRVDKKKIKNFTEN